MSRTGKRLGHDPTFPCPTHELTFPYPTHDPTFPCPTHDPTFPCPTSDPTFPCPTHDPTFPSSAILILLQNFHLNSRPLNPNHTPNSTHTSLLHLPEASYPEKALSLGPSGRGKRPATPLEHINWWGSG